MKYKLTITFDELEIESLKTYLDAENWWLVVWELDQWLQGQAKDHDKDYQEVRAHLRRRNHDLKCGQMCK